MPRKHRKTHHQPTGEKTMSDRFREGVVNLRNMGASNRLDPESGTPTTYEHKIQKSVIREAEDTAAYSGAN